MRAKWGFVAFLLTLICVQDSFAQDYKKWGLPEDAIVRLGKGSIDEMAYRPDGDRLAVASSIGIWIYDTGSGKELALLTGHTGEISSITYSPDGKVLANGNHNGTVRLWDANTHTLLHTLTGHFYPIRRVVYSPDGKVLVSGSDDATVRLWDVNTGALLRTLNGHTSAVFSLAYSPDGKVLATGSGDGTVLLWKLALMEPNSESEQLAADVNTDGIINIQDLVFVATRLGQTGENGADVNGDGEVNIQDLVLVAAGFGNGNGAPPPQ